MKDREPRCYAGSKSDCAAIGLLQSPAIFALTSPGGRAPITQFLGGVPIVIGKSTERKGTVWVVHFHADGGQTCVPGRRVFANQHDARQFAERMRNERGHRCENHTWIEETDSDPGNL